MWLIKSNTICVCTYDGQCMQILLSVFIFVHLWQTKKVLPVANYDIRSVYEWWQNSVSLWVIWVCQPVICKTFWSPHILTHHVSILHTSSPHTRRYHLLFSFSYNAHTHTVGSIKHLNTTAVKQIAEIQQGHVGSKSWDRFTLRRGGCRSGLQSCSDFLTPYSRQLSLSLRLFQITHGLRYTPITPERDDGRITAEQKKANGLKLQKRELDDWEGKKFQMWFS